MLFVGAANSAAPGGARSKRTKSGHSAHADDVSKGPSALTGEIGEGSSAVPKPSGQPWSTLRASAVVVPLRIGSPRASDASPWRLGLAPLTSCGRLSWPVELRRSVPVPSMKAGRSDLCTRYQHGSAGHSPCFVTRVSELCRISLRFAVYWLGTLKWWRSPPPTPLKHASNEPPVDSAGAGPCHVGVPLSDRNSVAQTPLCPVWAEMVLC